mgnify:CR=1 FL=1
MTTEELWQEYIDSLESDVPHPDSYQEFAFGDTTEMAEVLGKLVLDNVKTGTASLAWEYANDNEPMPRAGEHAVPRHHHP